MSEFDQFYDEEGPHVHFDEKFRNDAAVAQFNEVLRIRKKYTVIRDTKSKQATLGLQEDVKALGRKFSQLEDKVSLHDSLIEELEFRINSTPFEKNIDEILHYATNTFNELDSVAKIHYAPLEGNILQLIVIHDMKDRVRALKLTQNKLRNIEDAFSDMDFELVLLHSDEVQPDHLMGTKPAFSKM